MIIKTRIKIEEQVLMTKVSLCLKRRRVRGFFTFGTRKSRMTLNDSHNFEQQQQKDICKWRTERLKQPYMMWLRPYLGFWSVYKTLEMFRSFLGNINLMSVVHVAVTVTSVKIFQLFNIHFDVPIVLFVSPIVFPLAFSINSDFQR